MTYTEQAIKIALGFAAITIGFILFLNFFGFITSLVKQDPMIQETCNKRIPPVMFMYHFGCYITGNTYN